MELVKAETLARDLMLQHGLLYPVWNFKFDNSKKRFGVCKVSRINTKVLKGEISLSKHLVLANDIFQVKDTILHEIAHALTLGHGHDRVWKAKCIEIGAIPEQYYTKERVQTVEHLARYQAVCGGCGRIHAKHRMTIRVLNSKMACRCQAKYNWDDKILLKFVDTKK